MIGKPEAGDGKTPKLLIMDNGPLAVLSNLEGALDWFFVPGCEVWMTDMVLEEARRPSPPGGRARNAARKNFEAWFKRNRYRIKLVETREGRAFAKAMKLWELAGRPEEARPDASDYGEASILSKLRAIRAFLTQGESVIVVMDDRDGRAAVKGLQMNVDLMGTRTFIALMDED